MSRLCTALLTVVARIKVAISLKLAIFETRPPTATPHLRRASVEHFRPAGAWAFETPLRLTGKVGRAAEGNAGCALRYSLTSSPHEH